MEPSVVDLTGRPQPGFLTLGQAAETLGCTTVEMFRLVRQRGLPAVCTPQTGLVVALSDLERARSLISR